MWDMCICWCRCPTLRMMWWWCWWWCWCGAVLSLSLSLSRCCTEELCARDFPLFWMRVGGIIIIIIEDSENISKQITHVHSRTHTHTHTLYRQQAGYYWRTARDSENALVGCPSTCWVYPLDDIVLCVCCSCGSRRRHSVCTTKAAECVNLLSGILSVRTRTRRHSDERGLCWNHTRTQIWHTRAHKFHTHTRFL